MARVLVTGADGFIGRALCARLRTDGHEVIAVTRNTGNEVVAVGDIVDFALWAPLLADTSAIVHLAARAHVFSRGDDYDTFRRINVDATVRLARAAVEAGVRRFVFLSSIGVNGDRTLSSSFSESDPPAPVEHYAVSKWEAEQELLQLAAATSMEVVRVRPPLVMGPGVRGNLLRLLKLVDRELPLPLGGLRNRRSFVALDDLCALLSLCVEHPSAGSELFLAADEEEISTSDLLRRIAAGLGRRSRLFAPPLWMLQTAANVVGAGKELDKITSSLRVDATRARRVLNWSCHGLERGIDPMCQAYLRQSNR